MPNAEQSTTVAYMRDKKLNVRAEPAMGAEVIRQMRKGDSEEHFGVKNGWVKLRDGYAMAKFLEFAPAAVDAAETAGEPERGQAEQPITGDAPDAGDDERAILRNKTVPELRDIAEQSGISVKKGAKKEELIDALLSDD